MTTENFLAPTARKEIAIVERARAYKDELSDRYIVYASLAPFSELAKASDESSPPANHTDRYYRNCLYTYRYRSVVQCGEG